MSERTHKRERRKEKKSMGTINLTLGQRLCLTNLIERQTIGDVTSFRQVRTIRDALKLTEAQEEIDARAREAADARPQRPFGWPQIVALPEAPVYQLATDSLRWLSEKMTAHDWVKPARPDRPVPVISVAEMVVIADTADAITDAMAGKAAA